MIKYFQKLFKGTKAEFLNLLNQDLEQENRRFVVTANPEAFMLGDKNSDYDKLLSDEATTIVADGIGIVKGAEIVGVKVAERIPGVEIAEQLFYFGNEMGKSIFLFGAKPEVIEALTSTLAKKYPNLSVVGAVDGYVENKEKVFEEIVALSPDIVLVALGMPEQEKMIYKYLSQFKKGIFVGVGGSFDVLSGTKERAPRFFINHNIEWLYRILKEPKRLKRFFNNNVKFIFKLKKLK